MQLDRKSFLAMAGLSLSVAVSLAGCAKAPSEGAGSGSAAGSRVGGASSDGTVGAAGSAASPADSMDASLAKTYSAHGALLATIDAGVRAATELDMYAIVDWHVLHDQNPLPNFAAAQKDGSSSRGSGPANQL